MPKEHNIHSLMLLESQMTIARNLKKGDLINAGPENLTQIEQILIRNKIGYEVAPANELKIYLITIK